MIERYFLKGARFRTNMLTGGAGAGGGKQPSDGSIVVTPQRPPGVMIYVGIDRRLAPPPTPVFPFGANARVDYNWLAFVEGRTTRISTRSDVLTGPMSGCWITVWTEGEKRWIGHVGSTTIPEVNDKVKGTFATAMPRNVVGYQPDRKWSVEEISGMRVTFGTQPAFAIIALVTTSNQLFSALFFSETREPDILICGGCKAADGVQYQGVFDALLPKRGRAEATEPIAVGATRPRR